MLRTTHLNSCVAFCVAFDTVLSFIGCLQHCILLALVDCPESVLAQLWPSSPQSFIRGCKETEFLRGYKSSRMQ